MPDAVRAEIRAHALEEDPNESCGLVLLDGDRATDYVRGRNAEASPYRFRLEIDPLVWADIGDTDLEQGVVHSHLFSDPYPSRTDVENIGLWEGRPYLIYCVAKDALAAFRIEGRRIEPLPLS